MQRRFFRRALLRGAIGAAAGALAGWAQRRGGRSVVAGAVTGFATGAVLELPAMGVLAVPAAVTVARAGSTGVAAGAIGGATAVGSARIWPRAPRTPADIRPMLTPLDAEPSPDGEGLTIVVNPSAGPALRSSPVDALREALPRARIVELDPDGPDLPSILEREAPDACAIGVAGGDGSVNTAAAIAHRTEQPLVVVPAGTLNHLARDLGLGGVDDAIEAVKHGQVVAVDVGCIDGQPFLNTASFGTYSDLVDAREKLERHIGKWPALVLALAQILRNAEPVHVELDGTERRIWMFFAGNCCYHPAGFAPAWRERLDDGLLDVRLVGAERPYARLRLLAAVMTGRLGRTRVHEAFTTERLHVRSLDGPLRLAHDGETFEGAAEFSIEKLDKPLAVYVPRPEPD